MPELPEVECVRRTLAEQLVGRRIEAVRVMRSDVITGDARPKALLAGQTIQRIDRHGKQLALIGQAPPSSPCVVIHLGMSGQLRLVSAHKQVRPVHLIKRPSPPSGSRDLPTHCHVLWRLADGMEVRFIDPRRFGGLWTYPDIALRDQQWWARLGMDALNITPAKLANGLQGSNRAIKAALLDQRVVAGLGNIYVDELLFSCRISPLTLARSLTRGQMASVCRQARSLLSRAIEAGGSTLRDYVDAKGQTGGYQHRHRVYGRSGLRCVRRGCGTHLETLQVAGRTTVYCPECQK